jgi:hypothetical protein
VLVAGDAAPAALLQHAERLLDHGDPAREHATAPAAPAARVDAGLLAA